MRKSLQQTETEHVKDLLDNKMPFSMRRAAMLLHEAVIKNLDIDELDRRKIKKPEQTETESDSDEEKKKEEEQKKQTGDAMMIKEEGQEDDEAV